MMYDPFARGQYPVGVRTIVSPLAFGPGPSAASAATPLELELWYPAADRYRGQDLAPATQDRYLLFGAQGLTQDAVRDAAPASGAFPLVVFSHGLAGHRRQSTFLCTHLASHGYLAVAPDHGGSTLSDLLALALRTRGRTPDVSEGHAASHQREIEELLQRYVVDRSRDLRHVLDASERGTFALPTAIVPGGVALAGHSLGGFSALQLGARDGRVRSIVALAPAGGTGPLSSAVLARELTLDFAGHVATLYLALACDALLPLAGIEALYRRTPAPARMFVLENADHLHVCDRAEQSHEFFRNLPQVGVLSELMGELRPFAELAPSAHGYAFANGLALAHLDATLKSHAEAEQFLAQRALAAFHARGIAVRAS